VDTSNTTKHIFSKKILSRRAARIACVQSVYALLIVGDQKISADHTLLDIINLHDHQPESALYEKIEYHHLITIVRFASEHKQDIDNLITPHLAAGWSVGRLPMLVYCIITTAITELSLFPELKKQVTINDYLEIAKFFNHDGEVGFINTVLDKAAHSLKLDDLNITNGE
jgi:N utilization substance protein B